MFSDNANKYNYDYNYYQRKKANPNRYIINEDQDMDDDYGFFVILDYDHDAFGHHIYMNGRDRNRYTSQKNNNKKDENKIRDIQIVVHVPKEYVYDSIVNRPLSYNTFVKTVSNSPVMNIYGLVCNLVNWFFS